MGKQILKEMLLQRAEKMATDSRMGSRSRLISRLRTKCALSVPYEQKIGFVEKRIEEDIIYFRKFFVEKGNDNLAYLKSFKKTKTKLQRGKYQTTTNVSQNHISRNGDLLNLPNSQHSSYSKMNTSMRKNQKQSKGQHRAKSPNDGLVIKKVF